MEPSLEVITVEEGENLLGKREWVICGRNDLNYMFNHTNLKSIKVIPKGKLSYNIYLGRWDEICPIFCKDGKLVDTERINKAPVHFGRSNSNEVMNVKYSLLFYSDWYLKEVIY